MNGFKVSVSALAIALLAGASQAQAGGWMTSYYGVGPFPVVAGAYYAPAPVAVSYAPVVTPVAYAPVVPGPIVTTSYMVPTTTYIGPVVPYAAPYRVSYFPRRGVVRFRY